MKWRKKGKDNLNYRDKRKLGKRRKKRKRWKRKGRKRKSKRGS
jgi:hypothetical protein